MALPPALQKLETQQAEVSDRALSDRVRTGAAPDARTVVACADAHRFRQENPLLAEPVGPARSPDRRECPTGGLLSAVGTNDGFWPAARPSNDRLEGTAVIAMQLKGLEPST
jgi:hypothetical protein